MTDKNPLDCAFLVCGHMLGFSFALFDVCLFDVWMIIGVISFLLCVLFETFAPCSNMKPVFLNECIV